ncbi:MAG TPA: T9SS type A sorting domain-containing protein [bacterium]|jgi:hypothetical protein
MKSSLVVWVAVLVIAVQGWAQPDTVWTHIYGQSSDDYSYVVQETPDGGVVVAGSMSSPFSCELVKTTGNGTRQWIRNLGPGSSYANDVRCTADGGYVLAGAVGTVGALVLKTDSSGAQSWSRTLVHDHAVFASVFPRSDGSYMAAGHRDIATSLSGVYYARLDSAGNAMWERTLSRTASPALSLTLDAACATPDGGFVGAGTVDTVDAIINEDFYIIRVNGAGDTLWTRSIGGAYRQGARSVQATGDGYVIGGFDNRGSSFCPHVVKVSESGEVLWNRVITTVGSVTCAAAYEIEGGDLIISGTLLAGATGVPDFYLARVAPNDTVLWSRRYGSGTADWVEDMKLMSDGGCVITGRTQAFGAAGWDFYVVRTSAVHTTADAGPQRAVPVSLTLTSYPNPFNATAAIEYSVPQTERVALRVYDVLGREVATLADGAQTAGVHSLTFDGAHLPSGIYFARLQAGQAVQTRKMMLLK